MKKSCTLISIRFSFSYRSSWRRLMLQGTNAQSRSLCKSMRRRKSLRRSRSHRSPALPRTMVLDRLLPHCSHRTKTRINKTMLTNHQLLTKRFQLDPSRVPSRTTRLPRSQFKSLFLLLRMPNLSNPVATSTIRVNNSRANRTRLTTTRSK